MRFCHLEQRRSPRLANQDSDSPPGPRQHLPCPVSAPSPAYTLLFFELVVGLSPEKRSGGAWARGECPPPPPSASYRILRPSKCSAKRASPASANAPAVCLRFASIRTISRGGLRTRQGHTTSARVTLDRTSSVMAVLVSSLGLFRNTAPAVSCRLGLGYSLTLVRRAE